ncbi:PIG-L family deacetylase [Aquirufa sp. TARAVU-A1A]
MKKLILACLLAPSFVWGQNGLQLLENLKRIESTGTVLHVAAHPDDESTHMLAWFAQEQHWETNYFAFTRGDGGQNLIGDEQGIPLGLIRTQELLAARRIDGANQYFSQAFDFGFSKSTDEALSFWNKELVLSNLVYVIRKLRPDIIFTRFPPDSRAGHGHHSASAALAIEAYSAAADPKRFPEQLKGDIKPWKATRLLWNTFRFAGTSTVSEDQFKVQIGNFLPIIGQSTGELAALSRSQHKSQGFGFAVDHGKSTEYFQTLAGIAPKKSIDEGVADHWQSSAAGAEIERMISLVIRNYQAEKPYLSIPDMIQVRRAINKLGDSYLQSKKIKQIDEWIVQAAGIHFAGNTNRGTVAQGDPLGIKTEFIVRSPIHVGNLRISVGEKDTLFKENIIPYTRMNWSSNQIVRQPITQPYWLVNTKETGHFVVKDQTKIGQAAPDPAMYVQAQFTIEGEQIQVSRPVQELVVDPVKGEYFQPITVTPRSVFQINHPNILLPRGSGDSKSLEVQIKAIGKIEAGRVRVLNQAGETLGTLALEKGIEAGTSQNLAFTVREKDQKFDGKETWQLRLAYETTQGNWIDSLQMESINYPHIPVQRYFSPVSVNLLHIDFKKNGKRIGYIKGAGDKVPESLEQMGYQVDFLQESDLKASHLAQYDVVLTGVRAHNTLDYLGNAHAELMKYVEQGGNYVVQYNTASFVGPLKSTVGPYPLTISRNRITKEEAEPKFLLDHALFHTPNEITERDFDNWIQERSIYLGESNDTHYQFPLAFTDPGEAEQKGNIAVCRYGKGQFIYTGLVFFRELPAGVPGAWRLMANLLDVRR